MQQRDRRALVLLGIAAAVILIWYIASPDPAPVAPVVSIPNSIPAAERRLTRLRQIAAGVPGKEQILSQASAELAAREKGLLVAPTAAQAQAQLLTIFRRVGQTQQPPIDVKTTEMGQIKPLSDDYGEVAVAVTFETRIETLLNLMADLGNQAELIAASEMRLGEANPKHKVMPVRLTVTGVVRRDLIPQKKGTAAL